MTAIHNVAVLVERGGDGDSVIRTEERGGCVASGEFGFLSLLAIAGLGLLRHIARGA